MLAGVDIDSLNETEQHMVGVRLRGQPSYDQICPDFEEAYKDLASAYPG